MCAMWTRICRVARCRARLGGGPSSVNVARLQRISTDKMSRWEICFSFSAGFGGPGRLFAGSSPGRHIIYGYLEIGQILPAGAASQIPEWASYHPHASPELRRAPHNVLYTARDFLSGTDSVPGAGTLRYHEDIALTMEGKNRTAWKLPELFRTVPITYHSASSWQHGHFRAASRGQEFVVGESAAVSEWARSLVMRSANMLASPRVSPTR
jgi:hypothetical protein